MSRYTDIDLLIEAVEETDWYHISKQGELARGANSKDDIPLYKHSDIKEVLNNAPIADVVPKSEVDKTIAEWAHLHADVVNRLDNAKSEFAREIFEEIEFDIHQLMFERDETRAIAIEGVIANLKKKYTESCTDCQHFVGCECFDGKTCDEYTEKKE